MVIKNKNPLFVLGWDIKMRPSGSLFVITWQAGDPRDGCFFTHDGFLYII